MSQRILIPLDPSPYTAAALDYGCYLAKLHNAEITGLVVLDTPGIEKSIGPVPTGAFHYAQKLGQKKEKEARERIHTMLEVFKEKCVKEGVAHREAECQGRPSPRIIQDSLFYDLIIMGMRTYFQFGTSDKPGDSLEKLLDHSITPLLMVPDRFTLGEKSRVLIAFNGSLPSARAIRRYARLFRSCDFEIRILTSHKDKKVADHYLNEAEAYLKAQSIHNIDKIWTTDDKIAAMKMYLDWADLIVLGAHSKKKLGDFMIGSLNRYLIKDASKPLLLGQ